MNVKYKFKIRETVMCNGPTPDWQNIKIGDIGVILSRRKRTLSGNMVYSYWVAFKYTTEWLDQDMLINPKETKNKKPGRKTLPDKKVTLRLYVLQSVVADHGGVENAQDKATKYLNRKLKKKI